MLDVIDRLVAQERARVKAMPVHQHQPEGDPDA
jgi:hypothetical protein